MKKAKTFIAGMSLMLVLGLASCGSTSGESSTSVSKPDPVINVIPVAKSVKISVPTLDGATITLSGEGKQADGSYLPGTKAKAAIEVTAEGKIVDWVSVSSRRVLPDEEGNYTFTVPNADCELSVTLADGAPIAHELNAEDFPTISAEDIEDAKKVYDKFETLKAIVSAAASINEQHEIGGSWVENGDSSSDSLSPMNSIWGFHSKDNARGTYEIYSNDVLHGKMTFDHYSNGPESREFEFGLVGDNNFYSHIVETLSNDTGKTAGTKTANDKLDLQILCKDGSAGVTSGYPVYPSTSYTNESIGKAAVHSFIGTGMLKSFFGGDSNSFNNIKKEIDASAETEEGEEPTYNYSFGTGYTLTELTSTLSEDKKSVTIVVSDYKDSGSSRYVRKAKITIDGSYFITNVEYDFGEYELSKAGDGTVTVAETPTKANHTAYSFKKGIRSYTENKQDLSKYCIDDFTIKFDYTLEVDGSDKTFTCEQNKMQNGGKVRLYSSTKWNVTPTSINDSINGKVVLPEFVGVDESDSDIAYVDVTEDKYGNKNYYLTAVEEGTFNLLFNNFNGRIISVPIEVTEVMPLSVSSGMSAQYFYKGESLEFTPSVSPSKANQDVTVEITGDNSANATLDKVEVKDEDDNLTGYKYKLSSDTEGTVDVKITSVVDPTITKTYTVGVYNRPEYATLKANLESKTFKLSEDFLVSYQGYSSISTRNVYAGSYLTFSAYEDGATYGKVHYLEKTSWSQYNYYWYYQLKDDCSIIISQSQTLDENGNLDGTNSLNSTSLNGYIKVTDVIAISNTALSAGFSYYNNKDASFVTYHTLDMVDRVA